MGSKSGTSSVGPVKIGPCNLNILTVMSKNTLVQALFYSLVSNTSNVLNKRNIGPLGHKLIKITDLIRVTVDQFSFF